MKCGTRSRVGLLLFLGTAILMLQVFTPSVLSAQVNQGKNAIYVAGGGNNCCAPSAAFVDASMFIGQNSDFCSVIYQILSSQVYSVTVIDARGLNVNIVSMVCLSGTPWNNGTTFLNKPSTILLPAGVISIPTSWVLPSQTHLIGEGDATATNTTVGTTIRAASSFSGSMLVFGNTSGSSEISVENLTLDGNGQNITGIQNQNAGQFSYVDHVNLYQILGTGLSVSASDSGPYTNINFDTGVSNGQPGTVCASLYGTTNTRGFHNISCTAAGNTASAAILLDSSNNSIEDVRISGFADGIRVGHNNAAQSNVLVNVLGDTAKRGATVPIYTIHVTHTANSVSDLTIMGAGNSAIAGTYTIADDLTGIHLTDNSVALYALGKPANNGYSLFTTSPNVPSWATGTSRPTNTCAQGSLYSCSGTSTDCQSKALWGCPVTSSGVWVAIK